MSGGGRIDLRRRGARVVQEECRGHGSMLVAALRLVCRV